MSAAAWLLSALLMLAVPAAFAQTATPAAASPPAVGAEPSAAVPATPAMTPAAPAMVAAAPSPALLPSPPTPTITSPAPSAPSASPGSMLQVMVGLLLVLGLLIGITWFLKRMGAGKQTAGGAVKVVGGISVGNRERILVVEVADQWIVVGVTPTTISALSTMPRQAGVELSPIAPLAKNFSDWLKQTIDKRNSSNHAANNPAIGQVSSGPDNAH